MDINISLLKKRVDKAMKAGMAETYIMPLLKQYKKEIFENLERGQNIEKLHGMAFIIKRIEQDILKDISHGEDAKNLLKTKTI